MGLSYLQSKTYLNLAKLGKADVKTLAKTSNTARQDIYRIMPSLQKLGLAEKIVAKTTMYKATPIKEGLCNLLQYKKEDYIKTKKQVNSVFNNFNDNCNQQILNENIQFTITSERGLLAKMHQKLADMTKKDIDFVFPLNEKMLFQYCNYITRTIRRGVKIRAIVQEAYEETISKTPKTLSKNPLFEIRYLPRKSIPFGMHIFDKQQVTLSISEKAIPSLWTNSPHVIKLAETHFEDLWNEAQKKCDNAALPAIKQSKANKSDSALT